MKRLALIGASDLGQLIAHHARDAYDVVGFFDNKMPLGASTPGGTVLGGTDRVRALHDEGAFDVVLVGVGYTNPYWRRALFEEFADLVAPPLIHPRAYVDPTARVGKGVVALPGVLVDMNCVLEDNVFLNLGALVAHDSQVGAHGFLAPAAALAGYVTLGTDCFVGLGAKTVDNIAIASGTFVAAGAVVTRSIDSAGTYIGVPARRSDTEPARPRLPSPPQTESAATC